MAVLHIFRDGAFDGPTNMARDEHLLHSQQYLPAALRIYGWEPPTISLGYFQRFASVAELPPDVRALAVVRRPTGGGAILHDREITYCLMVDQSLAPARQAPAVLYRLVHEAWRETLSADVPDLAEAPAALPFPSPRSGPFFCFAKPGRTDLVIGADKLLGSAQRRIPGRVLQHGSLLLGRRYAAHPGAHLGEPPADRVECWIRTFTDQVARRLGLAPVVAEWDASARSEIAAAAQKYASREWTELR